MPNTYYNHSKFRRFLRLAKLILGLVLLTAETVLRPSAIREQAICPPSWRAKQEEWGLSQIVNSRTCAHEGRK